MVGAMIQIKDRKVIYVSHNLVVFLSEENLLTFCTQVDTFMITTEDEDELQATLEAAGHATEGTYIVLEKTGYAKVYRAYMETRFLNDIDEAIQTIIETLEEAAA